MYEALQKTASKLKPPKATSVNFGPWPGGVTREYAAEGAQPRYLESAVNMVLVENGVLRTRDGARLVVDVTGDTDVGIIYAKTVRLLAAGGAAVEYVFVQDENYLAYLCSEGGSGWTATSLGYFEGPCDVINFMGDIIAMDGSYGKRMHYDSDIGVLSIIPRLLYDNGSGADGWQFNNRSSTSAGTTALGNGTNTRVAYAFTSASHDTGYFGDGSEKVANGYFLPVLKFYVTLQREGNGFTGTDNVSIDFKVRKVSDDSVVVSGEISATAGAISTDATEYEVLLTDTLDPDDCLRPSTSYYASVEYSNGDATHHIKVHHSSHSSGSALAYYDGSWNASAPPYYRPLMGLGPGVPPKMRYGRVNDKRLYTIEGVDGDNPSRLSYSAAGNQLDYSTASDGGYAALIDTNALTYPIGAIAVWNGAVWVFGSESQPVFSQLTGDVGSYVLSPQLQKLYTHQKAVIEAGADIYFAHRGGIDSIVGVQEYGDVRNVSLLGDVQQSFRHWYDSDGFAGYLPDWGVYLYKPKHHRYAMAVHVGLQSGRQRGGQVVPHAPVTFFDFAFSNDATAECFGEANSGMYVGGSDGKLYIMDKGHVKDGGNAVSYSFKTGYRSTRKGELAATALIWEILGKFGGTWDFKIYRNHSRVASQTISCEMFSLMEHASPEEWTMPTDMVTVDLPLDDTDIKDSDTYYDRREVNFNFRTVQIEVSNITLEIGYPLYFRSITLLCDRVGGY